VERHIADGLEAIFEDSRVRNLKEHEIRILIEDDYQIRTERQELKEQEAILVQGQEICKQISMRSDLGPVIMAGIACRIELTLISSTNLASSNNSRPQIINAQVATTLTFQRLLCHNEFKAKRLTTSKRLRGSGSGPL
jgi:hypothetical protein